jgi:hypothetical protein
MIERRLPQRMMATELSAVINEFWSWWGAQVSNEEDSESMIDHWKNADYRSAEKLYTSLDINLL